MNDYRGTRQDHPDQRCVECREIDARALATAEVARNAELDWARKRPGVFDGFHRCLPAFAEAGSNTEYDLEIDATQPTEGNLRAADHGVAGAEPPDGF